jgi:hypothetical protein
MEAETEETVAEPRKPLSNSLGWLREQQEAIRKRGNIPMEFTPIKIKGEPLSMTIIRERRGDFDDDPIS